ncbi:Tim44/TimA family putative adaptor protein [Sphingosinicella humi]|uniref:Preprotein translocase subunit Tim44 n=1 Tax=Allosphingosinicella humi TaxID=2068657 RepID=A0A2U2J4V9_9SPHN|nr:Tim44/TimA family putative adaptor protein [Sphingosinicella humi]PWG03344.1 preprotein translocase subunit Tim44 [Sphingosinicella humi]
MTVEIVLLALVALFVGLRLYAVLGRRTGHEQQPVTRPETVPGTDQPAPVTDISPDRNRASGLVYEESAAGGIRAIVAADPSFDVARFLEGAQAAYRMILEAFWKGDQDTLVELVGDDVRASFAEAIAEREAAGYRLDNRLITIERAMIEEARLDGRAASLTVRFDADIAAVTRNQEGEVIAGSMSDAVETHDIWTFRRTLGSDDPNWLLVETDEA